MLKFTENKFDEEQTNTIGVDFKVKFMTSQGGLRVKTTIWDTAGQERFRTLTSSYYRGSHGIIIVFNVCDLESFENLDSFLKEVKENMVNYESVEKILVGNKIDMIAERLVDKKVAELYAKTNGLLYLETSAKNDSINKVFDLLVERILLNPQLNKLTKKETKTVVVDEISNFSYIQDNCCLFNL